MKKVWISFGKIATQSIIEEVEEVLQERDFNVELFGVSNYAKHLPKNYTIVNYESRDTLAICDNGRLITDKVEIAKWEENHC